MRQLPLPQILKLASLYTFSTRSSAISVLGTRVLGPAGLSGLATSSLSHSQSEIHAVFSVLAEPAAYPVLVHCTQGKDRTGLIVLLVLLLLRVPRAAIETDYMRSEGELAPERQEKLDEIRSLGLPDSFADCPEGWVDIVCGFLESEFGGVEDYLLRCGVTAEMQERIRGTLLE